MGALERAGEDGRERVGVRVAGAWTTLGLKRPKEQQVTERDRLLWTAIRRALMMIVAAIDTHLKEPTGTSR